MIYPYFRWLWTCARNMMTNTYENKDVIGMKVPFTDWKCEYICQSLHIWFMISFLKWDFLFSSPWINYLIVVVAFLSIRHFRWYEINMQKQRYVTITWAVFYKNDKWNTFACLIPEGGVVWVKFHNFSRKVWNLRNKKMNWWLLNPRSCKRK